MKLENRKTLEISYYSFKKIEKKMDVSFYKK